MTCRRRLRSNRFQDEARIGQKNGQVRQWAKRGTRPRQPADQRYDNAYLFGAICPARGVGAALALPYADTEAMQLHLDEISRHVAKGAHAVLLLDRAGWHTTAKLDVPNITPISAFARARTEPRRKHLAVPARQLALQPRLRKRRRHHRRGMRGLAKAHRPARNDYLHRDARLGAHRSDLRAVGSHAASAAVRAQGFRDGGGSAAWRSVPGVRTDGAEIAGVRYLGVTASLAGTTLAARSTAGSPSLGAGLELDVIAVVIDPAVRASSAAMVQSLAR